MSNQKSFNNYKFKDFLKFKTFLYKGEVYSKTSKGKIKNSKNEIADINYYSILDDIIPLTFKGINRIVITHDDENNIKKDGSLIFNINKNLDDIVPLLDSSYFETVDFPNIFKINVIDEIVEKINMDDDIEYMKKVYSNNEIILNGIHFNTPKRFYMHKKFKDKFLVTIRNRVDGVIQRSLTEEEKLKYNFFKPLTCFYGDSVDEIEQNLFYLKLKNILTKETFSIYKMNNCCSIEKIKILEEEF